MSPTFTGGKSHRLFHRFPCFFMVTVFYNKNLNKFFPCCILCYMENLN
jgi:hypothetical protein